MSFCTFMILLECQRKLFLSVFYRPPSSFRASDLFLHGWENYHEAAITDGSCVERVPIYEHNRDGQELHLRYDYVQLYTFLPKCMGICHLKLKYSFI